MCYGPQFSENKPEDMAEFQWAEIRLTKPNEAHVSSIGLGARRRHPFSEGLVDSSPQMSFHIPEKSGEICKKGTSPNHGSQMGKVILVGNGIMGFVSFPWEV